MKHYYASRKRWLYFVWTLALIVASKLELQAQNLLNIQMREAPVELILSKISEQSNYDFTINTQLLKTLPKRNVNIKNMTLEQALEYCLKDLPLDYVISDKTVIIKEKIKRDSPTSYRPNTYSITGIVKNEKGNNLADVTVRVKNNSSRVLTKANGSFEIVLPSNEKALIFNCIGYEPLEVEVSNSNKVLSITMKEIQNEIDEVAVTVNTGYFEKSKQTFTGAASSFSGAELRAVSNQNVLTMLNILDPSFKLIENNQMGSNPNEMPDFQIRGSSSIASNLEENFKGKPNLPTFMLDGFEVSIEKIYDLDPQRISGVTILKDAAALAIYGSRGANGVVVISTYPPKSGKIKINYSGSVDLDFADLSGYNLLNAREKLDYEVLAGIYNPNPYIYIGERHRELYNERLKMVQQGINTDWIKKPVKSLGINSKQSLTLEGGDQAIRYAVDLSYNPSEGVMKGSSRNRKGIGVRLAYNYKNLKFSNNLSFDNVTSKNSPYGSFQKYAYLNPYYSPYDDEGNVKKILFVLESVNSPKVTIPNPLYNTILNTRDESAYDNFINNFGLEWRIGKRIRLSGDFSLNKKTQTSDVFKPADHIDFMNATKKGSYQKVTSQNLRYEGRFGIAYTESFDKHLMVMNANYNILEARSDSYTILASGFPNDRMDHVGMGLEYLAGSKPTGVEATSRLIGGLANMNYSYDGKYLADFAFRLDGSSQFGSNKRFGTFWSSGIGWNLHNESFIKNFTFINLLKLRGSIGYTGSQNFYPYQAQLTYGYLTDVVYDDYIGTVAKSYGNTDLQWQKTYKRNVGVDFELASGRISGYFNYYSDYSKDVLTDVTMPPSLGFNTYKANLGEVQNKGLELSLRGSVYRNTEKKIFVNIQGVAVRNENTLKKISNALQSYNNTADANVGNKPTVRYFEGQSMNTLWVVRSQGIDPATGQEVFMTRDGRLTSMWSAADYIPFATTDPTLEGTFGLNMGYKGLQVGCIFRYQFGGYTYNQTLVDRIENVNPNDNVDRRVFYERWKYEGDIAAFKAVSNTTTTRPTSRFVQKNDLVELKSLNISYILRSDRLKQRYKFDNMRFSLFANDIFRSSTVKLERGLDYPFARHIAFTVQATF
ncbi:SusC/RagA family TonB-linked outer membrane protein [Sphingobacterium sp. xlx-130]|uniref:SusC/RagA family TonB-linked outer membrane protein n=1 Tax=Sphingobacterium sp. xlx-130 TaxID=2654323 RepID=UPI0013DA13C6|nr:SusC/RagA family TonB-linked outer membrane protein [Sphingobacterium sp. xlx-130]